MWRNGFCNRIRSDRTELATPPVVATAAVYRHIALIETQSRNAAHTTHNQKADGYYGLAISFVFAKFASIPVEMTHRLINSAVLSDQTVRKR